MKIRKTNRIKKTIRSPRFLLAFMFLSTLSLPASAQTNGPVHPVDLPSALRLAGANNLDVRIARERLNEARANQESATWRFFPWLAPGFAYRAHDGYLQETSGNLLEVHRDSYEVGPALVARVDLGDAIYKRLAARQLSKAAEHAVAAQRQTAVALAATGYFDLARAGASVGVAREATRLAEDYASQVAEAVGAGLAFKGDELRARTQLERNRFALRQARERQRLAAARLARTLRLDPAVELEANEDELTPLSLIATNASLDALVTQALNARPDLRRSVALVSAAKKTADGARYGPLVPTVGARAFVGGLAGGSESTHRGLSESQDYEVSLGWRIGSGGLFDRGRIRAANARLNTARLTDDQLRDDIVGEVVEAHARWRSAADRLVTVQSGLAVAEETFQLTRGRKEFGVGVVLETIQAEQELTRLRQDYFNTVSEFNQAQYQLLRATGGLENDGDQQPNPSSPAP